MNMFEGQALSIEPQAPGQFDRALHYLKTAGSILLAGSVIGAFDAAPAAAHQAGIVLDEGIAGVDLGASSAKVTHVLGKPASKRKLPDSGGETLWNYPSQRDQLSVGITHGHVTGVTTYSNRFKTSNGIGVGSSEAALMAADPTAECTPGGGPGGSPESLVCTLKTNHAGKVVEAVFEFTTEAAGIEEVDLDLVS